MTNPSSLRTVVFAGGGTGGHLFPGIAVAQELLRRDAATRILFVGSEKPIEREILGRAGFEQATLSSVSPSLTFSRIVPSLAKNWRAYRQAQTVLASEKPSVVIGLGGFASAPPVLAARRGRIPIVLLEQNVIPGKATRWLSRFANVVCLPWNEAAQGLPAGTRTIVTGNPIRQEIAMLASERACRTGAPALRLSFDGQERPSYKNTLLILGGSQGATALNALVLTAIEGLLGHNGLEIGETTLTGWRIVHQTGIGQIDEIRRRYAALNLNADVQPFLSDMAEQYRRATCVISRAGATTLAELACAGLPAILVPLPTSAHDHQRLNAKLFADRTAAILIEQQTDSAASVNELGSQLVSLLNDEEHRQRLRNGMMQFAKPDAASAVVDAIEDIERAR
ncbi:MAG: undecaprenyldiphospho-muramoylpentapeptide beta-N-acetylglucosaminyltransferase [Planctomycetia bacterium]|nr:undecaprenyldiphospho-muramoylpentapeptide beta-N-acetylglucosaminyltransferase [Planctomycetia bacterium]